MKRKKIINFVKHVWSFFDDSSTKLLSTASTKDQDISVVRKAQESAARIPVYQDGKLIEFQVIKTGPVPVNGLDEREEDSEDEEAPKGQPPKSTPVQLNGTNSPTSEEKFTSDGVFIPPPNNKPWNGLPHGPITHYFTHKEYLQMGGGKKPAITIHWAHWNRSRTAGSRDANHSNQGRLSLIRCKGLIKCDTENCKYQVRPHVEGKRADKQLEKTCEGCQSPLKHFPCPVECQVRIWKGGVRLTNEMEHNHPDVAYKLHALEGESEQFKDFVRGHPDATPLQLVVGPPGLTGPGQSVAEFSSIYRNIGRVGHDRRKVFQEEFGMGGDSFFRAYSRFKNKHPYFVRQELICDQDTEATVISFYSDFMRSQLVRPETIDEAVNGLLTDGAHKFFRGGILIVTSVYSLELSKWVPGLFTYSNGATSTHYKQHFLALFKAIQDEAIGKKMVVHDELFAGVMDFSDAQRIGFTDAFIEFCRSRPDDQRTLDQLASIPPTLLKGCQYHFAKTVTRVARISKVVPPERIQEFKQRINALLEAPDEKEFDALVETLITEFPLTKQWLDWWLRLAHARMLFQSKREMTEELWDLMPATTNAEESLHKTLGVAHGNQHDFFSGAYALAGYEEYLEATFEATSYGVPTRYGGPEAHKDRAERFGQTKRQVQASKKRPRQEEDETEDDRGRPPDTLEELSPVKKRVKTLRQRRRKESLKDKIQNTAKSKFRAGLNQKARETKKALAGTRKQKDKARPSEDHFQLSQRESEIEDEAKSIPTVNPPSTIICYPFNRNSCWEDCSLVLLFATLSTDWPEFSTLFGTLSPESPLRSLFECLNARHGLEQVTNPNDTPTAISGLLATHRDLMRRELVRFGAIQPKEIYEYQSLWPWLQHLARRTFPDKEPDNYGPCAFFELVKTELHQCTGSKVAGFHGVPHVELVSPGRRELLRQLTHSDHSTYLGDITIWFRRLISLDRPGPIKIKSGCWRVASGKRLCRGKREDIRDLVISIPVVLIIEFDDQNLADANWNIPEHLFPMRTVEADKVDMVYELTGLCMFSRTQSHFISRFTNVKRDTVYAYDDLANGGHAIPIPDATITSHLCGNNVPLPADFKICSAIYYLRGGTQAQLTFFKRRQADLAAQLGIQYHSISLKTLPDLDYVKTPFFELLNPPDRKWLSNPYASHTREYTVDRRSQKDWKTRTRKNKLTAPTHPEPSESAVSSTVQVDVDLTRSDDDDPLMHQSANESPSRLSAHSAPNEDFAIECRCGEVGDGNTLYQGNDLGEAICCDGCQKWSHIACQRNGRAHHFSNGKNPEKTFLCDECDPNNTEKGRVSFNQKERERLKGLKTKKDLPPLKDRLMAGTGALSQVGDFWYPVRLIQRRPSRKWKVRWWRGCQFEDDAIEKPDFVHERWLIDSLWLDTEGRRQIRLGKWTHPPDWYDKTETILEDPTLVPYTEDVDNALKPHQEVLVALLAAPETISIDVVVPAMAYLKSMGKNPTKRPAPIPYAGGLLSIMKRAQIANWYYTRIEKSMPKLRHMWLGCLPMAHAITLFLAEMMVQEADQKGKLDGRTSMDFLPQAWELQMTNMDPEKSILKLEVVDVDAECLWALEEKMFERSREAGRAGYYQWGLSAGDHQEHWDPYAGTPEEWDVLEGHADVWSDSVLEPGPNFIEVPLKEEEPPPRVIIKPRPIGKPAMADTGTGTHRHQPPRTVKK